MDADTIFDLMENNKVLSESDDIYCFGCDTRLTKEQLKETPKKFNHFISSGYSCPKCSTINYMLGNGSGIELTDEKIREITDIIENYYG